MLEKYLSLRILLVAALWIGFLLTVAANVAGFGEYSRGLAAGTVIGTMYFAMIIRQTVRMPGMSAQQAERHAQAGFVIRFVAFVAVLSATIYLPGVSFPGVVVGFLVYQAAIILYGFSKLV